MWALEARDLERLPKRGWIGYLTSGDPAYPLAAFQQGLEEIRRRGGATASGYEHLRVPASLDARGGHESGVDHRA